MEFLTLVKFSKLVADSSTSEGISALLAQTIVNECMVDHALVFGTNEGGDFEILASHGNGKSELSRLNLAGIGSVGELRPAVLKACSSDDRQFRAFPLISNTGLFGALGVLYPASRQPADEEWGMIEALTELTAISLNKAYQQQTLQKAFDDLRASQEVLVRTEKFRALGQMSAGIAHDLKNLLNPLTLYADEIRDNVNNPGEILDLVTRVDRVLNRGLETVERLRDYSRVSTEDTSVVFVDLNAMVREAAEISKAKWGATKLTLELGAPPPARLRPSDCVAALVNLIFNAVDAVEAKGSVTIRTGTSEGGAWVEVVDNGPGIPPEVLSRILAPLFTTKGSHGTGLGVSSVYTFATRHGGRLDIESEPGKGATFRMWFPPITSA